MEIRNIFRRRNEVTLNRIHHTVTIVESGERLKLTINADPMRLVAGLNNAQKKMNETIKKEEPTEAELMEAAEYFSGVLFGHEQTDKLKEFYAGDAACIINVCGQIFQQQLAEKIAKAQKKMG